MFGRHQPPTPGPDLEGRIRELISPLSGAEPATPAARSALRQALGGGSLPRSPRLHAWQRAAVSLAGVFVPLFAIGSVTALGGTSAVTAPLDAVAGVFKANGPRAGEPARAVLDRQEEAHSTSAGDTACEEAAADARAGLEGLLESGVLPGSAAAGAGAALALLSDCAGGAAICIEATTTAQEILQALLDTGNLSPEGRAGIEQAIAAIGTCGTGNAGGAADASGGNGMGAVESGGGEGSITGGHGGGPGNGHETCFPATGHAREVIQAHLDNEDRPEQRKKGLEHALEAIENCGTGNGKDEDEDGGGESDSTGDSAAAEPGATTVAGAAAAATPAPGPGETPEKPGTAGAAADHKPVDAGPPGDHGKPETPGKPAEAANPPGSASGVPGAATSDHGHGPGAAETPGDPHGGPPTEHPGNGGGHANGQGNGGGPQSKPGRP